jgi:glycosyltransferase involved in cell wall biosynthesis
LREEVRAELGIQPEQVAVLWMGRMVPVKGIELLADVVRATAADRTLQFLIAGDGPERSRFTGLVAGCDNVRMLAWQRDVAPLLKACDMVLLTSINEGTPTSLIEAMFASRPFIATNAGGTSDLAIGLTNEDGGIRQAKNGFIVERSPEAVNACLRKLAADAALRQTMGRCGHEHAVQNWSRERLVNEIKQLYYDLTASAKGRAQAV